MRRLTALVIAIGAVLAGIGSTAPSGAAPVFQDKVASLASYLGPTGARGLVFAQQTGTQVRVRGLLVGLTGTSVTFNIHKGTCAAPGPKLVGATFPVTNGTAAFTKFWTAPANTLYSIDGGLGVGVLRRGNTVIGCDVLGVWDKAHKLVPVGVATRAAGEGSNAEADGFTPYTGIAFLDPVNGSGTSAIVFVQQHTAGQARRYGVQVVTRTAKTGGAVIEICRTCTSDKVALANPVLGNAVSTTIGFETAGLIRSYDTNPGVVRLRQGSVVLAQGPVIIYSLSNDEQFPA